MPNIFDQFDTPTATVTPDGKNPFDAFDDNPFDQFDEPAPLKFANLPGNLKLNPLQQVQMQSGMADPENAGATLSNLLRGNDDVFLQTVAPPITAAAHALLDNPVTRKIGYGLNFAGQAVKGDVESALFQTLGFPELANQQLIATADNMNPAWKQKDESLGIDTSDPYEDARQTLPMAQRMASGIGPDLLQSVPQMVLAALQPELGAASFGFTPQGFDPVQAAAAMVAPGGGKMIGGIAEGLAAKTGLSNEQVLDVINRVGGGAGVAGLISAPTAYQITQTNPGQELDQAIQDATANAILTGFLGSISGREELSGKLDNDDTTLDPGLGSNGLGGFLPNGAERPVSQKIDDLAATIKSLKAAVKDNQLRTGAESTESAPETIGQTFSDQSSKPWLSSTAVGERDGIGQPSRNLLFFGRAENLAQKLESLKTGVGKRGQLHAFGVGADLWDRAVTVAQNFIRGGGTVADAIDKAIRYVRGNFKAAFDEDGAREALSRALGPPKNAGPGPQIVRVALPKDAQTQFESPAKVRGAYLQPYKAPGGGHHVPAKAAFIGAPRYNLNLAPAIPNPELTRLGVDHDLVSGAQQTLYRKFAQMGQRLTWNDTATIEIQALIRGGATRKLAEATVNNAINILKKSGVTGPTRIPWRK